MDSSFWLDNKTKRNMNQRRTKSREAARDRRQQEQCYLADLLELLPLPAPIKAQLDKASIVRLVRAFMQGAHLVQGVPRLLSSDEQTVVRGKPVQSLMHDALDGFVLVLATDGSIIYVSEHATKFIGLATVDLLGQSMYEMTHPCDHSELRQALSARAPPGDALAPQNALFLRLKSTLTSKGRSLNIKAAGFNKVMMLEGAILEYAVQSHAPEAAHDSEDIECEPEQKVEVRSAYVALCHEIPSCLLLRSEPEKSLFKSRHGMDLRFQQVEANVTELLGYSSEELEGRSFADMYHAADRNAIDCQTKQLLQKGQVVTEPYRMLARKGGFAWVQTSGTVQMCARSDKQKNITLLHELITGVERPDLVLSVYQQEARGLMPRELPPASQQLARPSKACGVVMAPMTSPVMKSSLASPAMVPPMQLEEVEKLDEEDFILPSLVMESFFQPLDPNADFGYNFDLLAPALDDVLIPLEVGSCLPSKPRRAKMEVVTPQMAQSSDLDIDACDEVFPQLELLPGGARGVTLAMFMDITPVPPRAQSPYEMPQVGQSPTYTPHYENIPEPQSPDLTSELSCKCEDLSLNRLVDPEIVDLESKHAGHAHKRSHAEAFDMALDMAFDMELGKAGAVPAAPSLATRTDPPGLKELGWAQVQSALNQSSPSNSTLMELLTGAW